MEEQAEEQARKERKKKDKYNGFLSGVVLI